VTTPSDGVKDAAGAATAGSTQRVILAVVDFSSSSNDAASRAAQVASQHGAALALLHVLQAGGDGPGRDAPLAAARTQLERLARRLERQFGVAVTARTTRGDPLREVVAAARDAHLLVIGSKGRNTLAEFLLGTPAERIIRMARVPALVVKRPSSQPYQNILAPVALSHEAHALVSAALEFSAGADVEVFHALCLRHETALRSVEFPEPVLRRYRAWGAERARKAIQQVIEAAGGASRARAAVGYGPAPATALRKEAAMLPDLVVVGKRHQSLLADFLLGSVTRRLLSQGQADTLVMPIMDGLAPAAPVRTA
jgi:nucleotide-binding universal stress UspA family protein